MKTKTLEIEIPEFTDHSHYPGCFTACSTNINPPITIRDLPRNTYSVAVEISNPDAPVRPWIHWLVWNIPALGNTVKIKADSSPGSTTWNDFGQMGYTGPLDTQNTCKIAVKAFALNSWLPHTCGSPIHNVLKSIYNAQIASKELNCICKPVERPARGRQVQLMNEVYKV